MKSHNITYAESLSLSVGTFDILTVDNILVGEYLNLVDQLNEAKVEEQ